MYSCLLNHIVRPVSDSIHPEVFEEFYKCWKGTEITNCDVTRHLVEIDDPAETVLKLSDTVKCSFGTGRIGLTKKRCRFA